MQAVSPNSPSYNYPDATLDAKIALRDWLADEYGCSNPAGGIEEHPCPVETTSTVLRPDCGSAAAASALAALNAAWHTSYTTWSTSDVYGEAGIKVGGGNALCSSSGSPYSCCTGNGSGTCHAYSSYGTGTGLLDENGSNVVLVPRIRAIVI